MRAEKKEISDEAKERRLNAYIEMLKTVYEVDEYGLADMLGMYRGTWTRNRNAPLDEKSPYFYTSLALVSGTSVSWLIGERERF